ncbi:MAG TPA: hypothetical protein VMU18_11550 [Rhodoblastus sp.]|nr:hypothetical protein [Rhodoblastus sp.]
MTEHCGWNEVYWTIEGRQCAMYQFVKLNGDGFGVFDRRFKDELVLDERLTNIPFLFIEQFAKWPLHRQWTAQVREGKGR